MLLQPSASFRKIYDVSIQYLIFSAHFLISLYKFSDEPNPRTQYIGCYVTRYDSICIFLSWVLLLLYDKGAVVNYYRIIQIGVLNIVYMY